MNIYQKINNQTYFSACWKTCLNRKRKNEYAYHLLFFFIVINIFAISILSVSLQGYDVIKKKAGSTRMRTAFWNSH